MTILPFGAIAFIPIILSLIFGLLAFKLTKQEAKNVNLIKIVFLVVIVALSITIYRTFIEENTIDNNIESVEKEKKSEEEAIEELEGIEIEN